MGKNSKIEWTDHTFNPWMGCTKVSDGCKSCYAETMMDKRYGKVKWGPTGERIRTSRANWLKPLKWNRDAENSGVRAKVFCASLADVFEDRDELHEWRLDLFELILNTPNLDWLLLTKRPENIIPSIRGMRVLKRDNVFDHLWPDHFPNVWLGVSVEDQKTADDRIHQLLKIPAKVRFLSVEPLLEPVNFMSRLYPMQCSNHDGYDPLYKEYAGGVWLCPDCGDGTGKPEQGRVGWVIVGGETGPGFRRMDPGWARFIRDQCADAGVPFFFKQMSNRDPIPDDLMVRQFPEVGS